MKTKTFFENNSIFHNFLNFFDFLIYIFFLVLGAETSQAGAGARARAWSRLGLRPGQPESEPTSRSVGCQSFSKNIQKIKKIKEIKKIVRNTMVFKESLCFHLEKHCFRTIETKNSCFHIEKQCF